MPKRARKAPSGGWARAFAMANRPTTPGTAMPPTQGAPEAVWPVSVTRAQRAVAPIPINDRFPVVIGQALSLSYVANVFRLATTGYRQQYVDLLNELLEQDGHLYSVIQKRVTSSATGRLEISPVKLPEGHPDTAKAKQISDFVAYEVARIPDMSRVIAELAWGGVYYGLIAQEIFYTRDSDGWHVERFGFVHSRRLSYPNYQSWDLYVWDQGQVYGFDSGWGDTPTNSGMFGLRVADFPGKFLVYAPQLRGDYPTRNGIGRQTATWACFKRVGARGAVEYLERFAKPMMDVEYSTQKDGKPREATKDDILLAAQIAAALGVGSGSYAAHADSIRISAKAPEGGGTSSKLTWPEWIAICNAEEAKAALGGTLGTDVGKGGGNRSLGEVQERGEVDLEKLDASQLADAFRRDVVTWLVRLNRPDCLHLIPIVTLHVDTDPDPKSLTEVATSMTKIGAPVDLDKLSEDTGIQLVPNPNPSKPRRSFVSDMLDPSQVDPELLSDEAKQQLADAQKAQQALAEAKANQPVLGEHDPDQNGGGAAASPPARTGTKGKAPKKSAKGKPATKDAADEKAMSDTMRTLLLVDRDDRGEASAVFEQLLDDYPAKSLGWVLSAHWSGPQMIPLDQVDFAHREQWRASHEPIDAYVSRIEAGRLKPIVVVKTPGNPKYVIVDGHHRTLASEKLKRPVLAYVAKMHVDQGPWDELHDMQKKGSSKAHGDASWLPSSWTSRATAAVGQ